MKQEIINFVLDTISVRLACLRHAASVHPEPGSNSQKELTQDYIKYSFASIKNSYHHSIVKERVKMRTKKPGQLVGMVVPKYQWSYGLCTHCLGIIWELRARVNSPSPEPRNPPPMTSESQCWPR